MQKDNVVEQKQDFLRDQIIDQGYSPEDFLMFLFSQKQQSEHDINNWTLPQLKEAVKNYKQNQTKTGINPRLSSYKEIQPSSNILQGFQVIGEKEIAQLTLENHERVEYQKTNLYDNPLKKSLKCIPFKGFLQDISNIKFDVLSYQVKTTGGRFFGLGKITQLWYSIKCSIVDVVIKRSDSDFSWLRNTLVRLYPGHIIPPFQQVLDIQKQTKKTFNQRMELANLFLKSLYHDQIIFNSKLVISFLTWSDHNKFIESKKSFNASTFTRSISQIQHPEGKIDVQISTQNMSICKSGQILANELNNIYDKLIQQTNFVSKQFDGLSSSVYYLGSIFKQFQQSYQIFSNTVPQCKNNSIASTIITITNSLIEWGKIVEQQKNSICRTLDSVLKFNKMEMEATLNMIQRRNSWKSEYLKLKDSLIKKKQKIISEPNKWEVGDPSKLKKLQKVQLLKNILPKETGYQQRIKSWLAYINKQSEIQIQRILSHNIQRLSIYWTNYGIQMLKSTQDILEIFKNISNGALLSSRKSSFTYE